MWKGRSIFWDFMTCMFFLTGCPIDPGDNAGYPCEEPSSSRENNVSDSAFDDKRVRQAFIRKVRIQRRLRKEQKLLF